LLQPSHGQFQAPADQSVSIAPLSSSLSLCIWAVGPSALPCAGAAPPQRPALASHPVHAPPATCLANSIPPKRSCSGSPCASPVLAQSQRTPRQGQAGTDPASLRQPAYKSSHRRHNLPAKLFPPQIWDPPHRPLRLEPGTFSITIDNCRTRKIRQPPSAVNQYPETDSVR